MLSYTDFLSRASGAACRARSRRLVPVAASRRSGDVDADRAVVRPRDMRPDERVRHALRGRRRREHVIDPPADVPLARAAPLPPPRVVSGFARMPGTERVDPAGREPATELCAFLRKEATGLRVLLRPREVDFLVRGVEVADHEHRAASLQSFDVIEDGTVELELVRHAAVVALAAAALREIAVDDEDASEAGGDEPALVVETRLAEPDLDGVGRRARVDRDAAVSQALRGREACMPSGRNARVEVELIGSRAYFLNADHVRPGLVEETGEALLHAGTKPVHVPADYTHRA